MQVIKLKRELNTTNFVIYGGAESPAVITFTVIPVVPR